MPYGLKRGLGDDVSDTITTVDSGLSLSPVLIVVGVAAVLMALFYTPSTRGGGPASSAFPKDEWARSTPKKRRGRR